MLANRVHPRAVKLLTKTMLLAYEKSLDTVTDGKTKTSVYDINLDMEQPLSKF